MFLLCGHSTHVVVVYREMEMDMDMAMSTDRDRDSMIHHSRRAYATLRHDTWQSCGACWYCSTLPIVIATLD